jgi:replicative DNA helicase
MTLFEALPPYDNEAEESLIASLMVDETLINRIAPLLEAGDFFREQNGWVYQACRALWERDEPVNMVFVAHELDRHGHLEEIGGMSFLSDLITDLPTSVGAEHYAALIKRDSTYRKMLAIGSRIAELAYEGGPNLEGAIAKAETWIYELREEKKARDFIRLADLLDVYFTEAPAEQQTSAPGAIFTGLRGLDALIGGFKPGELIVIGAATSVGKTALMVNFGVNAALTQRAHVAIFSLEMGGPQLAQRILSSCARIDSKKLDPGPLRRLPEGEDERVMVSLSRLADTDIYIDDTGGLSLPEMKRLCLQLQKERGLDLIVIDYLQLLSTGLTGKQNMMRVQEISYLTGQLKQMARLFDVPIIIGSQLSRQVDSRIPHIPVLADLRESGSIEQDADVVILIYREDRYNPSRVEWEREHADRVSEPYPEGMARLIVAKQRQGPLDAVEVRFRSQYSRFEDFDLPAATPVQMGAF